MVNHTLTVGSTQRSYLTYIPVKAHGAVSVPVVLVLHSSGSTPEMIAALTGFNTKADAEGFVVVYPRGTPNKQYPDRFWWNGGLCCGAAQKDNVDDVAFLRALLDDLAKTVTVDPHRVFAVGMFNGALMSYRLGCDLADRIAAIGAVAGTQNVSECRPSQAVSVIAFHGTADTVVPYAGGTGKAVKNFSFTSVKDTIGFWVAADQCPGASIREISGSIVHETYAPCSGGTAVELYTIQDGTHNWPGATYAGTRVAQSTRELKGTDILWDFFIQHPKPENAA